jgi:hypothetical protein
MRNKGVTRTPARYEQSAADGSGGGAGAPDRMRSGRGDRAPVWVWPSGGPQTRETKTPVLAGIGGGATSQSQLTDQTDTWKRVATPGQ